MPIVDSVDFFKEFLFEFIKLDFPLTFLFNSKKNMGSPQNPETNPHSTKKGESIL